MKAIHGIDFIRREHPARRLLQSLTLSFAMGVVALPGAAASGAGSSVADELAQRTACATQRQSEASHQRLGRRRQHFEELNASKCMSLDRGPGLFGGFKNSCSYKIDYVFCAYRPKKDSWAEAFDCERQKFGGWWLEANKDSVDHTHGAEYIYWAACRSPEASPTDAYFSSGRGIEFRCNRNAPTSNDGVPVSTAAPSSECSPNDAKRKESLAAPVAPSVAVSTRPKTQTKSQDTPIKQTIPANQGQVSPAMKAAPIVSNESTAKPVPDSQQLATLPVNALHADVCEKFIQRFAQVYEVRAKRPGGAGRMVMQKRTEIDSQLATCTRVGMTQPRASSEASYQHSTKSLMELLTGVKSIEKVYFPAPRGFDEWNYRVAQLQLDMCMWDACAANSGIGAGPRNEYPSPP